MLLVAGVTQRLQALQPDRPLRGLHRFSRLASRLLPPYEGIVTMPLGYRLWLNTRHTTERDILLSGTYQAALTHLLTQGRVVGGYYLDVGANLGFYTVLFAWLAGRAGRVAAFEANPALIATITRSVELNDHAPVTIVPKAVHDTSGVERSFYVSASRGKSSLASLAAAQTVISVNTITLDDFVEEVRWPRVDVLKMDIEGFDCTALRGARRLIGAHRPFIVFEFTHTTDPADQQAAAALLAAANYRLEYVKLNGERGSFEWRVPGGGHHVDVVAEPV